MHEAKVALEEKGYARIPAVFSLIEAAQIKAESYRLVTTLDWKIRKDYLQIRTDQNGRLRPALLFWPQDLSGYMKSLSQDPRMQNIVQEFLGPDVRQLNNQVYFREPGDGDEFAWHQDVCFRTPAEEFDSIETQYLQTIIVVDKILENAAIEFIPGSHKSGIIPGLVPRDDSEKGLRKFERGELFGEKVWAEPGDVLLWSVMVVHGSEQNISERSRMTYMNGFAAESAIKNKSRFPVYLKNGVLP